MAVEAVEMECRYSMVLAVDLVVEAVATEASAVQVHPAKATVVVTAMAALTTVLAVAVVLEPLEPIHLHSELEAVGSAWPHQSLALQSPEQAVVVVAPTNKALAALVEVVAVETGRHQVAMAKAQQ
jgi:hypothetical protein